MSFDISSITDAVSAITGVSSSLSTLAAMFQPNSTASAMVAQIKSQIQASLASESFQAMQLHLTSAPVLIQNVNSALSNLDLAVSSGNQQMIQMAIQMAQTASSAFQEAIMSAMAAPTK